MSLLKHVTVYFDPTYMCICREPIAKMPSTELTPECEIVWNMFKSG